MTNVFDTTVYHWLNGFAGHHHIVDDVMSFFAQYSLEMYMALFVISWFALPKGESDRRHALIVSVFAGVLALLLNFIIGHIWYRPRPFVTLHPGQYTQLIPHTADASFPSDHTSGAFAFSAAAWGHAPRYTSVLFTIIAVVVMVARVYVGVHWPTDVIAGLVVGIVMGKLTWKLSGLLRPVTHVALRVSRRSH